MAFYIICIIVGFLLLIKGADFLVEGASGIAKKFNIPTIIIGLTIVAIGTSMPELMVSTTASLEGHSDIAIGNVIGSNVANLFLILGVCSIIKSLEFQKETEYFENFIVIFATCLLVIFGNDFKDLYVNRVEGIILLVCCIAFILYNIFMAKRRKNDTIIELQNENKQKISVYKALFYIIIGIFALKIGGDVVVKYASEIAKVMKLSEKIISVTIIAFSTSLPELITSITATRKGETDMAIGNIIGSQVFNIFMIIGVAAILCPIKFSIEYNIDMIFLMIGTVIFAIFPFIGRKHYMTRSNGIVFIIIYIAYLIYSVINVL